MSKIKILVFVDRMLHGGIQSFIMNYYSRFDMDKFDVTVLTLDDGNVYPLEDEVVKYGIKLMKLKNSWISNFKSYLKYKKNVKQFFETNNDYDIFHLNSSGKNYYLLKCAKKNGIKVRIAHSHNTDFQTKSIMKKMIGKFFNNKLNKYANVYFGCSTLANKWMFNKNNQKEAIIIKNAVDCRAFSFNSTIRNKIREDYNISDKTVVLGNAARLFHQKNHSFLIDIFYEYSKINPDCVLMIVGDGILRNELEEKCKLLKIEKQVIFTGYKSNVADYYNAMDIFLFPSLYEGLGITIIEAEINGLPCYISSDVIPNETHITSNVHPISLKLLAKEWAEIIFSNNNKRIEEIELIKNANYDIESAANNLEILFDLLIKKECEKL